MKATIQAKEVPGHTFSGAPARFHTRRKLVVEEANAIGTAYMRLDLLPTESQPALRELFRKYMDSRLEAFRKLPDYKAAMAELAKSEKLQMQVWTEAVAASRLPGSNSGADKLVLPALNDMIDITSTRTMSMRIHPPLVIFELLFFLALVCSLLAGYGMAASKHRSWLHIYGILSRRSDFRFRHARNRVPADGLLPSGNRMRPSAGRCTREHEVNGRADKSWDKF